MSVFANLTLYLSLALSFVAILLFVLGGRFKDELVLKAARACTVAVFGLITTAMLLLIVFLITGQYEYAYVYQYTNNTQAKVFNFTALWAGRSGSLLVWTWMIAIFTMILTFGRRLRGASVLNIAQPVLLGNIAFFLLVLVVADSPFELLGRAAEDGMGMNPMLQSFGMVVHPITLFFGYAAAIVPFAFAMAALIRKDTGDSWVKESRRWIIFAWILLTLGNVLGGNWAYVEQGWGGYWAWDPVENASLMPWFTLTALMHSIILQERKNMLKNWNVVLATLSFVLTIFGTYLVRSGVVASVHSYEEDVIGYYFLGFLAVVSLAALALILSRSAAMYRSSTKIENFFSKEGSLLGLNILFMVTTVFVFWGTMLPVFSGFAGESKTVTEAWYNKVTAPVLLITMVILSFTPLVAWHKKTNRDWLKDYLLASMISLMTVVVLALLGVHKIYALLGSAVAVFMLVVHVLDIVYSTMIRMRATGENLFKALTRLVSKNRRRYGGYIVHIGVALMMLGVVGSMNYSIEREVTIALNDYYDIKDYRLVYESLEPKKDGAYDIMYATLTVFKNGEKLATMKPDHVFYNDAANNSISEVALITSLKEDLYVVIKGWEEDGRATFMIKVNPMVEWIWIGTYVMTFGGILAFWAGRRRNVVSQTIAHEADILAEVEKEIELEIEKAKGKALGDTLAGEESAKDEEDI